MFISLIICTVGTDYMECKYHKASRNISCIGELNKHINLFYQMTQSNVTKIVNYYLLSKIQKCFNTKMSHSGI